MTVAEIIKELRNKLETLPSSRRLTYADTETIYADAYALLAQGRYVDASKRFSMLVLYRPSEAKYWAGLGVSNQRMSLYDEAISAFAFAANIAEDNPDYLLSIAECDLLRRSVSEASDALLRVVAFCKEKRGFDKTRARAEALLELITKGAHPA